MTSWRLRTLLAAYLAVVGQLLLLTSAHAAVCSATVAGAFPSSHRQPEPEIQRAIELARSQNVVRTMERAAQQGFTAEAAIATVMQQAREFDSTASRAAKTAETVDAFGMTDEEFLRRLHNGTLEIPEGCPPVRGAAICAMAINRIAAIALRYTAREMRCFVANGQWPADAQSRQIEQMVNEAALSGQLHPKAVSNPSSTSETKHPFSTSTPGWHEGIGAPANVDPCRNCNSTTPKSSGTSSGGGGGTGVSRGVR